MLLIVSLFILSRLIGAGYECFPQVDAPQAPAVLPVTSEKVALLAAEEAGDAECAQIQGSPFWNKVIFEEQAQVLAAKDAEQVSGGWCSRAWSGVKSWWQGASWKKKIAWGALGTFAVASVGVGAVWLNGSYYLVYKSVKDFFEHVGASAPGGLINGSSGMVLYPTSSEVATSVMASAAGATATSVLTPKPTTHLPPDAGVCDLVPNVDRYVIPGNAYCWGIYDGSCVHTYGCAYNGDMLYHKGNALVCRCERSCNAPPKDLPCSFYSSTRDIEGCEHLPLCEKCSAHWCKECHNGWYPKQDKNISDPAPSSANMKAWLDYNGLPRFWKIRRKCLPEGSSY